MIFTKIAKTCLLAGLLALPLGAEAFETGDAATLGFDPDKLAAISAMLDADTAGGRIPGAAVMILKDGHLALSHVAGVRSPNGAAQELDDIFRIYSMTKPIVSVAALILAEQGKLDLNAPVSAYIPDFSDVQVATRDGLVPAERAMTVRDLMRHTSGMTTGHNGTGPARAAYRAQNLSNTRKTTQEMARVFASPPLEHQPGTVWEYSRSVDVLGAVVEIAAGTTLDAVLEAEVFGPLGMQDTSFVVPAEKRERIALPVAPGLLHPTAQTLFFRGSGGLMSTVPDYLNFAAMLVNGGMWKGKRLLSEESYALISTDQLDGLRPGKYDSLKDNHGFSLGLAVRLQKGGAMMGEVGDLSWGGYAGTYFWVDPKNDMAVVFMMQNPKARRYYRAALRRLVYTALNGS